jgi:hypothetical protein
MLTLLLITLLSACEESQTLGEPAEAPQVQVTEPVAIPSTMPPSERPGEKVPPAAETRKPDSLDLRIDDRPIAAEKSPVFGAAPDSGWLDSGQEAVAGDTGDNRLLPDMFGEQQREKPVSVKGRMLVDDGSGDVSDVVDGARMSIEIQTD